MGKQCIFLSTFIAIKVAYVMKLSFTHLVCEQKQLGIFLQDNNQSLIKNFRSELQVVIMQQSFG